MKNFFVFTTDESLHPENNFGNNIDKSTTDVSSCENPTNEMKDRATIKIIFTIILERFKGTISDILLGVLMKSVSFLAYVIPLYFSSTFKEECEIWI